MTTATMPAAVGTLEENAQALIDARLDTIERMLLGQVSRGDRLAIVREVESQIHDLLAERNPNDTDRDAVIATLARLDPPEAYLPDESGAVRAVQQPRAVYFGSSSRQATALSKESNYSTVGRAGGILGFISMFLAIVIGVDLYFIFGSESATAFYFLLGLDPILCLTTILAIIFSGLSRLRSHLGVVGLTTGIIGLLPALAGATLILTELLGGLLNR